MTYRKSIKAAAKCIRSTVEENVNKEQGTAAIMDQRIEKNRRLRIQGALTTNKIILPEPFTSKTPHRNPKQWHEIEDGSIPKEIIEQRKNCRGPAICIVPQKEGEKKTRQEMLRL
jgi:hypothetical protein